jgi:hypothetical protein
MRIFCFILLIALAYLSPFWLFLPAAIAYALAFKNPYELLLPAMLVDAHFGWSGEFWGLKYVLATGAVVILSAIVRRYLKTNTNLT